MNKHVFLANAAVEQWISRAKPTRSKLHLVKESAFYLSFRL